MATEADLVRGRIPPDGWVVEDYADLADVVAVMLDTAATLVPIVEDGRLVGIVSRRDVLRAVARHELTSNDVLRRRSG